MTRRLRRRPAARPAVPGQGSRWGSKGPFHRLCPGTGTHTPCRDRYNHRSARWVKDTLQRGSTECETISSTPGNRQFFSFCLSQFIFLCHIKLLVYSRMISEKKKKETKHLSAPGWAGCHRAVSSSRSSSIRRWPVICFSSCTQKIKCTGKKWTAIKNHATLSCNNWVYSTYFRSTAEFLNKSRILYQVYETCTYTQVCSSHILKYTS